MRTSSHVGLFLSGAATVALLAGCSSGGSQASPLGAQSSSSSSSMSGATRQTTIAPAHRQGFVNVAAVNAQNGNQTIVSDSQNNTVSVFGPAGALNALLTTGLSSPEGIATDAQQTLYVANTQDHNVLVYAKPYSTIALTLADTNFYPTGVTVSKTGVVAVTNIVGNPYAPGSVTFYAKGAQVACATVTDPGWFGMYFAAFDASGNLFMDGNDRNGNPLFGEITGGCSATSVTTLSIANTISNPGGMAVQNGNVLILDQAVNTFSPVIYTYAPPSGGSLGSPTATTPLSAGIEMTTFAFTQGDRNLWIVHSGVAAGRIEYAYPNGKFLKSFNQSSLGTAVGIAVNPAASF